MKLEDIYEIINEILYKYKGLEPLKVFTMGEIPESKWKNARDSYGHGEKGLIIALGDDTVFGSATEGFFITQEKFYFKAAWESSDYFDIADVEHIEKISESFSKGFKFRIKNRVKEAKWLPTQLNRKEQDQLFDFFNELFPAIAEHQRLVEIWHNENLERQMEEERIAKIQEEENKRKKLVNSKFNSANDELLQRVDKIFENINSIHNALVSFFLIENMIKNQYFVVYNDIFTDDDIDMIDFVVLSLYCETIKEYKNLENECNNLSIVASVLEKNQDTLLERLAVAKEFIEPYGIGLERFRAFLSRLYEVEISQNITEDELSIIAEKQIIKTIYEKSFVIPALVDKNDKGEEDDEKRANSALTNFFVNNSDGIIEKLKSSGVLLTASALQNNQNIMRIANIVYNLLPTPIRIFVSIETVENFLFENRDWLIDKIS